MQAVTKILNALKAVLPNLAVSDGSIEQKIIDVVGTYADSEAIERQNTLNVINGALASQKVTTVEYYRRKAVAFQQGDQLVYDPINQGGYYETIDPEKQIVKQAYISGSWPQYTMLVNKIGDDGHLDVLTQSELDSFKTYFAAFQPLGLALNIGTLPVARITDPNLVIYVKAGSDATSVAKSINDRFKANESVLRPNNIVSVTELSDTIQKSPEVVAVSFTSLTATETRIDSSVVTLTPERGLFQLTAGAFIFGTEITPSMIKVLE